MPPHQGCKSHLPRVTRNTSSTRPPRKQSPLGDLCHLTGPPVSPPQAIRAASPGLRAPRRSGRTPASRLRVNPRLQKQPAWRVEPAPASYQTPTQSRGLQGGAPPQLPFPVSLVSSSSPREALSSQPPAVRGGAPCRQGPGGPLRNWAQPRRLSGERGRSFPAPVKPPPVPWGR